MTMLSPFLRFCVLQSFTTAFEYTFYLYTLTILYGIYMFSYIDATSIRYVIYASRYDQISTRLSYSKKLKDKKTFGTKFAYQTANLFLIQILFKLWIIAYDCTIFSCNIFVFACPKMKNFGTFRKRFLDDSSRTIVFNSNYNVVSWNTQTWNACLFLIPVVKHSQHFNELKTCLWFCTEPYPGPAFTDGYMYIA